MSQPQPPIVGVRPRRFILVVGIALLALSGGGLVAAGIGPSIEPGAGSATPGSAPGGLVAPARSAASTASLFGMGVPMAVPTPTLEPTPTPTPTPAPTPTPRPTLALDPPPTDGPFAIDLFEKTDFVSESRKIFCVPAAMQTMVNIMSPGADHTGRTQRAYYALARKLSPPTLTGDGAEPEGWADGLNQLGFGPYVVGVQPTRTAAVHVAAKALRMTGRPVGLLVWYGAHSWVMSGFKATADPALGDDFTVTHVYIEDVWYPRISSIWGESRPPGALVPVKLLPEDFLRWKRPNHPYPSKDGKYVIVLPVAADAAG